MRPQSSKRRFKLADYFDLVDDFCSVKKRYQDQLGEEKSMEMSWKPSIFYRREGGKERGCVAIKST